MKDKNLKLFERIIVKPTSIVQSSPYDFICISKLFNFDTI